MIRRLVCHLIGHRWRCVRMTSKGIEYQCLMCKAVARQMLP